MAAVTIYSFGGTQESKICHCLHFLPIVTHEDPLSMGFLQARILEWVALPSSRGSSQSRDQTQVSHIASWFFTGGAPREAQECWGGQLICSPGGLPDPGIELGSPALQVDSLPAELLGEL